MKIIVTMVALGTFSLQACQNNTHVTPVAPEQVLITIFHKKFEQETIQKKHDAHNKVVVHTVMPKPKFNQPVFTDLVALGIIENNNSAQEEVAENKK